MAFRFRDWKIYKDLRTFRREVLEQIIPKIPKEERFEIISQLRRALNSTILNIAEGAYRNSDKDFAHFLNQSVTSLNEVVSCLDICLDDKFIDSDIHKCFIEKTDNLVAQLSGFQKSLKK